jgi:hypothetical protein
MQHKPSPYVWPDGNATVPGVFFGEDTDTGIFRAAANSIGIATGGTERARLTSGGVVIIGNGTTTSSSDVTMGLVIDQRGNDDKIIACQSSDVAHGMTGQVATTVFYTVAKMHATSGGASLGGWSGDTVGTFLFGVATNDNTTKSTSGKGYVEIDAYKKSGTTIGTPGADANILAILTGGTTRHIFDNEGTYHGDEAATIFDDYDDLGAMDAMHAMAAVKRLSPAVKAKIALMEKMGIFGKGSARIENGKLRAFVNTVKHRQLLHSGLRFAWHETRENTARLEAIEKRLAAIGA